MDEELQRFVDDVIYCLKKYGKLNQVEAQKLARESRLFEVEDDMDRGLLFHDEPYYWAMELLYGKTNPLWYKIPGFWPPPKDAYN